MLVGAAEGWAWRDRILAEYRRFTGTPIEELESLPVCTCQQNRLFSVVVSASGRPGGARHAAGGGRADAAAVRRAP